MSSPLRLYAHLCVPTEEVVKLGIVKIDDPLGLGLHRQIALPIVRAGHCICSAQHTPFSEDHQLECIYSHNVYRCYCVHCTHQSETPDRCTYKARRGELPRPDNSCRYNRHCYSRRDGVYPATWKCQRCGKETSEGPTLLDTEVEEVPEPPPPPPPATATRNSKPTQPPTTTSGKRSRHHRV